MPGQGGALSAAANPALPRHPEPAGRTAPVRCGKHNTATPAPALQSAQVLRADRRWRRLREGVRDGNLRSSLILFASKLSCEPPHRAKQIFPREGLRHVSVRALLLAPILVTRSILRGYKNHRNHVELRVPLQVAANLETVPVRHYHIEQNYAGPLVGNGF